jgi:quercetin dioxygenase-like cupin family protein
MIALLLAKAETPAARLLAAMQDRLPWGGNPVAGRVKADAPVIDSVALLMGPEGPVVAEDMRLGLFYQPPETYYGLHNHAAVETYAILAGAMTWTDGAETRLCRAGDFVHHASLQPHAFRTGAEGCLALWRWDGDIDVASYRMLE